MEGRAIARPNVGRSVLSEAYGMEGRAIARPNLRLEGLRNFYTVPSMEGRAIARPNPVAAGVLQWKAEQLPGKRDPPIDQGGRRRT